MSVLNECIHSYYYREKTRLLAHSSSFWVNPLFQESSGANEIWVIFDDDDDGMNREFEPTQVSVPPPFLVVRHGSPEVAPIVGSDVTMLEVTPMSRSLCLAAIGTPVDVEESRPLGYSEMSLLPVAQIYYLPKIIRHTFNAYFRVFYNRK